MTHTAPDWREARIDSDTDAITVWRAIDPTPATWEQKREAIPDRMRARLAVALLRGGNFACKRRRFAPHTCARPPAIAEPAPNATFDDPCFRRRLAMWALDEVGYDELAMLDKPLRAIAMLPRPEDELITKLVTRLSELQNAQFVDLMLAGVDAGWRPSADLRNLIPPARDAEARRHHIFRPADQYEVETDRPILMSIARDKTLDAGDRELALEQLHSAIADGQPLPDDLRKLLYKITREPDCAIAQVAVRMLADAGEQPFGVQRPITADVRANMRALCIAIGDTVDGPNVIGAYQAPGFTVVTITHTVDTPTPTVESQLFTPSDPWAPDDAITALLHACTGTHCTNGEQALDLTFAGAPDGGLLLSRVTHTIYDGACRAFDDDAEEP